MAKGKVLIVEDEAIIAEDIKAMLSDCGFETADFSVSADDAVKKTKELKPDLITMDIKLIGDETGIDAAIRIREFSNVPIIYMTGLNSEDLASLVRETMPYEIIDKPITETKIENCIKKLFKPG